MNTKFYLNSTYQILIASALIAIMACAGFFFLEPKVGQAVTSGPFTITQTITDEISFLVNAANVVATGTINGITGGTANGTTTAVVRTNSNTGYYMEIAFYNNGTDNAMLGNNSLSESIHDYVSSSTTVPDYNFSTASTSAVFAYTVDAVDPSDVDQSFVHNGAACDLGSTPGGGGNCWMGPSTSGFRIIDRGTAAANGATSTINFRIHVPNGPTPSLVADTYTATATLTALNQ